MVKTKPLNRVTVSREDTSREETPVRADDGRDNGKEKKSKGKHVQITRPRFEYALFEIRGNAPLVVHRFSKKTLDEMEGKREEGKSSGSKVKREPKSSEELFTESRYTAKEGWDGFHAGAIRNAMISVCRLVNFKMTLAKMSIFVIADGWDAAEPQIPLIKIIGEPILQKDMARVSNGNPYCCIRAAYHGWSAKVRIRWDADQFSLTDVTNLMMRVGMQAGLCEGRPDSKKSAGMGWGTFDISEEKE